MSFLGHLMDSNILGNPLELALVEKHIQGLTTILANTGHCREPSCEQVDYIVLATVRVWVLKTCEHVWSHMRFIDT
jgi:hypothetical protein